MKEAVPAAAREFMPRFRKEGLWVRPGDAQLQMEVLMRLAIGRVFQVLRQKFPAGMPPGSLPPTREEIQRRLGK